MPAAGPRELDAGGVGVVVGLEHDDLVARADQREQRGGDRLGGAGRHQDLGVGVEVQAVEPALVLRHRVPQFGDAAPGRVLVDAAEHGVRRRPGAGTPARPCRGSPGRG